MEVGQSTENLPDDALSMTVVKGESSQKHPEVELAKFENNCERNARRVL